MAEETEEKKRDASQHRLLFDAAWRLCRVWRSPDGDLFADLRHGDATKTALIERGDRSFFVAWLRTIYTNITRGSVCRGEVLTEVVNEFIGRATMSDAVIQPAIRVAGLDDKVWVDLGTQEPSFVEIDPTGWRIVQASPRKFIRYGGQLPLPMPVQGPPLPALLKEFIPVKSDEDMAMVVGWLVGALQPEGPYPILTLSGEQGSTKSTTLRLLKRLVDPSARELQTPPDSPRDYVSNVKNSYVIGFDNVSSIRHWFSDAMCRVATGTSALGGRKLYTDNDEASFMACRPQMLNGIPDFVERGDFLDRCIHINLTKPKSYKDDKKFWEEFDAAVPQLLGALYTAVATALARRSSVVLNYKPRMINFATWVVAAEPALALPEGAFLEAYKANRQKANEHMLEFSPLAKGINLLLDDNPVYYGTYDDLYFKLSEMLPSKDVPKTTYILASELRRLAPALRLTGIAYHVNGRSSDPKTTRHGQSIEIRRLTPQELSAGQA